MKRFAFEYDDLTDAYTKPVEDSYGRWVEYDVMLEFAEWFLGEADFGPSHGDVMVNFIQDFEKETGKSLPDEFKEGYGL